MKTYHLLSKIPILRKKFVLKILSVAFVAIHTPLFSVIGYLLIQKFPIEEAWNIIISTLIFTLAATLTTLWVLNKLLKPILLAKTALNNYVYAGIIENVPTDYEDEAGILLSDISVAMESLEKAKDERQRILSVLSQDLQKPLNSILNTVQDLRDQGDPIKIIHHNSQLESSVFQLTQKLDEYILTQRDKWS